MSDSTKQWEVLAVLENCRDMINTFMLYSNTVPERVLAAARVAEKEATECLQENCDHCTCCRSAGQCCYCSGEQDNGWDGYEDYVYDNWKDSQEGSGDG